MRFNLVLILGLLLASMGASGQDFQTNGTGGGAWEVTSSWQESFDGGLTWGAATTTPSYLNSTIHILSGDVVSINVAVKIDQTSVDGELDVVSTTLTLNNLANALVVNGIVKLTGSGVITSPAAADLVFNGIYNHARDGGAIPTAKWNSGSACNITGIVSTALTGGLTPAGGFYDFTWNCASQGATIDLGGKLLSVLDNLLITTTNGQQLLLASTVRPASAIAVGNNLQVDGNSRIAATTTATGVAVNVGGNFNYNSTNASGSSMKTTGTYTLAITGDFNMNAPAGAISISTGTGAGTINLLGNLNFTSGTLKVTAGSGAFNFNKVGTQTVTNISGGIMSGAINWTVSASTTLDMAGESFLGGSGSFMMRGTLLLESTHATGALVTGTAAGNIRNSGTRSYAATGTIVYLGTTMQQVIGSGHPTTAGVTTEINNSMGVYFNASSTGNSGTNLIIAGNLILTAGNLNIVSGAAARGLTFSGGSITTNGYNITFSGTNTNLTISGTGAFGTFPFPSGTQTIRNLAISRTSTSVTFSNNLNILGTFLTSTNVTFSGVTSIASTTTLSAGTVLNSQNTISFARVTIASGATFQPSSTVTITGNLANSGSFIVGNNDVNFTGAMAQTISGTQNTQFYNLIVNKTAGGTLAVQSAQTVTNLLTLTQGVLSITGNLLTVLGSNGATILRAAGSISTTSPSGEPFNLVYTGGSKTTGLEIPTSGNVLTVTINTGAGSTITLNKALNVSNALSISGAGMAFTCGANNVSVGSLTNAGTFNAPNTSASTGLTLNGDLTNSGTFNANTGTVVIASTVNINGTIPTFNNLSISGTGQLNAPASITIQGNFVNNGVLAAGSNTVVFAGGGAQMISGTTNTQFYNVNVNKGAGTITVNAAESVTNMLTLTAGTMVINSGLLSIANGGTINVVAGTITTSSPSGGPWNLIYSGTTNRGTGLEVPSSGSVLNFTSSNTAIVTLNTSLSVSQNLMNSAGTLNLSNPVSITGASSAINITGGIVNVTAAGSLSGSSSVVNLTAGTLNITSNLLNLANGSTINVVAGTITGSSPSGGPWNLVYSGTTAVVTGLEVPTSGSVISFTSSNTASVTLNTSLSVSQNLTNTAGTLNLAQPVSITGSSSAINVTGGIVNVTAAASLSGSSSVVNLTAGSLNISSNLLSVANGSTINVVAGTVTGSSPSGGPWNLIYSGSTAVATGFEIPVLGSLLSLTSTNSNVVTLSGPVSVGSGGFTLNSATGAFASGSNSISTAGLTITQGTLTAPSSTLTLTSGDLAISGTYLANGGTLIFGGSTSQTISGSNALSTNFNAITVNGSAIFTSPATLTLLGDFQNSGTFNASTTFNIQGNLNNDGTFNAGSGIIVFSGDVAKQIGGSQKVVFYNLTVNGGGASTDLILENTSGADLSGVLTVNSVPSPVVFDTDGASNNRIFTILSTQDTPTTSDASIAPLSAGSTQLPGKITVQRYMGRSGVAQFDYQVYRDISASVNSTVSDLQQYLPITGPFNDPSTVYANGVVDQTVDTNVAALTWYDESAPGSVDNGWTNFPAAGQSATSTFFAPGEGYSLFVFGSDDPVLNNGNAKWSLRGKINSGNLSLPVTLHKTGTGGTYNATNDGWNLVGNPYPSTIDWESPTGWTTKTNLDDAIYIDDYSTANPVFASYVNGVSTNGGSRYIPMGQAFWVKAHSTSPALAINENAKASGTQTRFFRVAAPNNLLRVSLASTGDLYQRDEAVVYFEDDATAGFDYNLDAMKLKNRMPSFSLSTTSSTGEEYAINALPMTQGTQIIPLNVSSMSNGTYQFSFTGSESLSSPVYIKDNFDNLVVDIKRNPNYSFNVDLKDPSTFGAKRFELIFGVVADEMPNTQIRIYPNPVARMVTIETFSEQELVGEIYDSMGSKISSLSFVKDQQRQVATYDFGNQSGGMYIIRTNQGGKVSTFRVLKY